MLLDDIIETAVDSSKHLSDLLRKCLLLAYELKNDRLKAWANQELNGYTSHENLPPYRLVSVASYGDFTGPLGAAVRNYPIPPAALEGNHQDWALFQSVSAYEDAVTSGTFDLQLLWPGNMVLYYQQRLMDGYVLVSAWQSVPKSSIIDLLDTIRNRTLNMALEIKSELGAATANLGSVGSSEMGRIEQTIVNNIYGGTNYFASGQSQITQSATIQTTISVGSRPELDAVLLRSGLTSADLEELGKAEEADRDQKLGSKVTAWIKA
ncbi:MAG TPA: hypothetical protein VG204_23480 [Terriglobia bacterium]|nr:hypothetical protein [Terriglobia bacterium]